MSSEKPAYTLRHFISYCSNFSITQNRKPVSTLIEGSLWQSLVILLSFCCSGLFLCEQGTIHSRQASAWPCKTVDELGTFFLVWLKIFFYTWKKFPMNPKNERNNKIKIQHVSTVGGLLLSVVVSFASRQFAHSDFVLYSLLPHMLRKRLPINICQVASYSTISCVWKITCLVGTATRNEWDAVKDDQGKGRSQETNGAQRTSKHGLWVNTQEDVHQTGRLGFTSLCSATEDSPRHLFPVLVSLLLKGWWKAVFK